MAKSLFPASELPKDGTSRPEWRMIALFMCPCIVAFVVLWLASLWWSEVFTENTRILLFGPIVLIWALCFPHVQGPLSKGRVDLVYYALAALSAMILYVDHEHDRRDLQIIQTKDQLVDLDRKVDSVNAKLEELRRNLTIATANRTKISEEMSGFNEVLAESKTAAADELGRREQANERFCADPETMRCTMKLHSPLSDKKKELPGLDPCKARLYNCATGMSNDVAVTLKAIRDATDVVALANVSGEALRGLNVSVVTRAGNISLDAAIAMLSSYGKRVSDAQRTESEVRGKIEAATEKLRDTETKIVKAWAELERLDALNKVTPGVMKSSLDKAPAGAGVPINTMDTQPSAVDPWKEISSVLARFVWGYVLIILVGLKIAREKFVCKDSKPAVPVLPEAAPATG